MSDKNTALPIRSEADGADERLHSKLVDFTDPAGVDKQAEISEKLLHVREHGQDPAGAKVQQRLSESGEMAVDGVYDAGTNTNPANIGLVGLSRDVSPADAQQTLRLTAKANGDGSVRSLDIALHDEAGEPFTESNPLPVTFVDSEGAEVNDYNASSDTAAAATSDHDYTVTAAKTLKLSQIMAAASGKMKIEVKVETAAASGIFNTKFVGFNSTANPTIHIDIKENIAVVAGAKVRITRTNLDNQAQNLYSTISGHEIP